MASRRRRKQLSVPVIMTDLLLDSWETVMRRTLLIAQNDCSPAEYRRMVKEKAEAVTISGLALISSGGKAPMSSLLAPWHRRAKANAKRLRKK